MTKKEFLDAVNEINDEFINEIIDIPCEVSENYFADEQPQKVYLTDKPVPFWKIAFSAAAAVCVLAAGVFAAARVHEIQPGDSNLSEVCPPHRGGNPVTIPVNNFTTEHNHLYYYDIDGAPHYKKCTITIKNYRQETRCVICDELLDSKGITETHHSIFD